MIQFTRLRLNGFKSFVDRTELEIGEGLNAIVGPNGCGKSNLVEALRWVMGESSAKRMRGGGMEDVIFNGTEKRSARNIAEVSLLLDNTSRTAPAHYNNSDELEIIRRIERDHGSAYKINGKNARARDVQMLFADTVTGANSPAMVSQGRVTQIINAKPLDRRLILEESAGISGLYARRHEAELRLKAADNNLIRIQDVLGGMEDRMRDLKRQARQASRYRNVSAQIRQVEIMVDFLQWQSQTQKIDEAETAFKTHDSDVADKMTVVTQLTKTQTSQSEDLPALRQSEAELAAALQTHKIELQRLEDEARRIEKDIEDAEGQKTQVGLDLKHEEQTLAETSQALERLSEEHKRLLSEQENEEDLSTEKQNLRDTLEAEVTALEEKYNIRIQGAAELKARVEGLESQIKRNQERLAQIEQRKSEAQEALAQKSGDDSSIDTDIADLEKQIAYGERRLETLGAEKEKSTHDIQTLRENLKAQTQTLQRSEEKLSKLEAEAGVLKSILDVQQGSAPVLNDVSTDQGFEKALSRALGDSLNASLEDSDTGFWTVRTMEDLPALPTGTQKLGAYIKGPEALDLALSQIGVVKDESEGERLSSDLQVGQSLVSVDGTYWRWDGYRLKSDAPDSYAQNLEQKNKYDSLLQQLPIAQAERDQASKKQDSMSSDLEQKQAAVAKADAQIQKILDGLGSAREKLSELKQQKIIRDNDFQRAKDALTQADEDLETLREVTEWDQKRLESYRAEENSHKTEDTDALREELTAKRSAHQEAIRDYDLYVQKQNSRKARLHAIADERVNLQNRIIRARERSKELKVRSQTLEDKITALKEAPQNHASQKQNLLEAISAAEAKRQAAADKLSYQENELAQTNKALKEAEYALSEVREKRAHAQATFNTLKEQIEEVENVITQKYECKPHTLRDHIAQDMDTHETNLPALKAQYEKLVKERDNIGPVNLRADQEVQELEKELVQLIHERDDLTDAIAELRGGIQQINKEARARLLSAFDHVDAHFQSLFKRLFGGGEAHLKLIDGEKDEANDPLSAGLEIYAQPPGKTLQSLSLLSGGEQTLASIALIFAMFLTNPSPICVLDEIDAPLDDSNVDRVCDLLEEIAERKETRFLIITHHRLTMARMDRLYGVTMSERGVSQLVSVDLQQSFDFLEEAA